MVFQWLILNKLLKNLVVKNNHSFCLWILKGMVGKPYVLHLRSARASQRQGSDFSHTYIWKSMPNGAEQLRNRIDKGCLFLYVSLSHLKEKLEVCSQTFYMSAQKFQRELDRSCIAFFLESETNVLLVFLLLILILSKAMCMHPQFPGSGSVWLFLFNFFTSSIILYLTRNKNKNMLYFL